jgi:hypothetical protein
MPSGAPIRQTLRKSSGSRRADTRSGKLCNAATLQLERRLGPVLRSPATWTENAHLRGQARCRFSNSWKRKRSILKRSKCWSRVSRQSWRPFMSMRLAPREQHLGVEDRHRDNKSQQNGGSQERPIAVLLHDYHPTRTKRICLSHCWGADLTGYPIKAVAKGLMTAAVAGTIFPVGTTQLGRFPVQPPSPREAWNSGPSPAELGPFPGRGPPGNADGKMPTPKSVRCRS